MRPVDRLRQAADDIAYDIARWHSFINALRDRCPDGYSPGGEPGPRSSDVADPTGGAVGARLGKEWSGRGRDGWAGIHQEAEALTIELQAGARRLTQLITSLGGEQAQTPDRCNGMGTDGYDDWGDPTCIDAPVRGPLCYRCYRRAYRWQKGLQP